MSRSRRVAIVGVALLALVVGGLAAAAFLIPGERVAEAVAARAEALLGQRVRIDDVGLRFLPLPGVRLSGVVVGGTGVHNAVASAAEIELRARLLPLLRGQVVIGALSLEQPRLLLAIDTAGITNLPVLRGDTAVGEAPPARDISFAIDRLSVSDGRIVFRDARDSTEVVAEGWSQQLRIAGEVRQGELGTISLAGWLEVDDLDATLPRVVLPVRDLDLRVTHDATLDRTADRLSLRSLGVDAGDVELAGTATIDSVSSMNGRRAALSLQAEGFDAARLVRILPDSLRARLALPDGRRMEPSGTANLRLEMDGPLTADSFPGFDGVLGLGDFALEVGGESLTRDVRAEVVFSADSAVARAAGLLLGNRFGLAAALRDPGNPFATIAFSGRADLERLTTLGLLPDTLRASGSVHADVRALVPLRHLGATRLGGAIDWAGLRIPGARPAIEVGRGEIAFQNELVMIGPVQVAFGEAGSLALRATARDWLAPLVDTAAAPPDLSFVVLADTLDLDVILGPSESEYPALLFARLRDLPLEDGRTAAETAEAAGMRLPPLPRVTAEGNVRALRLIRNGMVYDSLDATFVVTPDSVRLLAATFGLMGGVVRASGLFAPTALDSAGAPEGARLTATYALTGVGAAPFFDRLTPFRDHLAGDLGMAGTVSMDLDERALPERATVSSDGSVAVSNGRLANWQVLQAAAARLGLTALDTIRFRDWAGGFRITGPLVTLEETGLDGPQLSARAAGSFDFGGRLDLGATVYMTRELAARAGAVGQQVVSAAGTADRIPVGLRITGMATAPEVQLDLSEARDNVVARAREAAESEARQAASRATDAVLDRLEVPDSLRGLPADSLRKVIGDSLYQLLPDSLPAQADSLRSTAEEALRKRLRSLFGGG